jgi:hypothetical protein
MFKLALPIGCAVVGDWSNYPMKKKLNVTRDQLWDYTESYPLGHAFTLTGDDRQSEDDTVHLSHLVLETSIRQFIDADLDAVNVANRLRDAADQLDRHVRGVFSLIGWEAVADNPKLAMPDQLLEEAIKVRRKTVSNSVLVANWLRDAADLTHPHKLRGRPVP